MENTELKLMKEAAAAAVRGLELSGAEDIAGTLKGYHEALHKRIDALEMTEMKYTIIQAKVNDLTAQYLQLLGGPKSVRPFVAKLVESRGAGNGQGVPPSVHDVSLGKVKDLDEPGAFRRSERTEVQGNGQGFLSCHADERREELKGAGFNGHGASEE